MDKCEEGQEDRQTNNNQQENQAGTSVAHLCTVIDVPQSELLNLASGHRVVSFTDGTQWTYIPINQDGTLSGVDPENSSEMTVSNIEVSCEDGDTISAEGQVILLEDGQLAYIKPKEVCQVVDLDSTVFSVAEPDSNDTKVQKKKAKNHYCMEPGCERSYSSSHHLKLHVRNHSGDRPYACTMEGCTKAFGTNYSRIAHLRTHTGEKPYPCPEGSCAKSFKTSGDLQKHIRTHTGERPFVCPVEGCRRSFTTSNIRKVHIRTHTGERPYMCDQPDCGRTFASSTNYKNHMRIHSGEKPYTCNVPHCLKRFTEYSSLYKHQLVHSVHKRHQCPFCNKTYRQMSTLTTHKRTVHGVIAAEDGTEIILEHMIGFGQDRSKNFKNITSNLLNLKRDGSALIAIDENDTSLFIVSQGNGVMDGLEFGEMEDSIPI